MLLISLKTNQISYANKELLKILGAEKEAGFSGLQEKVSQFLMQMDLASTQKRPSEKPSSSVSITYSDYSSRSSARAKQPSQSVTLWSYLINQKNNEADLNDIVVEKVFRSKNLNRYIQVKT